MPELVVTIMIAVGSAVGVGLIQWGVFTTRLARVESDVRECVRREVYASDMKAVDEKMTRTLNLVERIYDRMPSRGESGRFAAAPRGDDRE